MKMEADVPGRPPRTQAQIERYLAGLIEEITLGRRPAAAIRPGDRLIADLGLDSLDYATVLLGCERWLGIRVAEEGVDWRSIQSVEQLARFLAQQQ